MVQEPDLIARAEAALEGITPGPWEATTCAPCAASGRQDIQVWAAGGNILIAQWMEEPEEANVERNSTFIAQAPTYVQELADEVKKLRGVVSRQERTIEGYEASTRRQDGLEAERDKLADEVKRLRHEAKIDLLLRGQLYTERDKALAERDRLKAELNEAWEVLGVGRLAPVVEFGAAGGQMTVQPGGGEPRTLPDVLRTLEGGLGVREAQLRRAKADRNAAEAVVHQVREALAEHPRVCDVHPDDDPITCGWKNAVATVQWVLDNCSDWRLKLDCNRLDSAGLPPV